MKQARNMSEKHSRPSAWGSRAHECVCLLVLYTGLGYPHALGNALGRHTASGGREWRCVPGLPSMFVKHKATRRSDSFWGGHKVTDKVSCLPQSDQLADRASISTDWVARAVQDEVCQACADRVLGDGPADLRMLVVRVTADVTSKIVLTSQASAMEMSRMSVELASTWHTP